MPLKDNLDLSRVYSDDVQRDYLSLLEKFPYRPTLFLGLGGTGSLAVSKVKHLFKMLYAPLASEGQEGVIPTIPPMYKFLAFDSDVTAKPVDLAKDNEWYHLGVKDLSKFYSGIGNTKFFKDWVIKDYPQSSITAGCAGFRNLGRLALLFNMPRVRDVILKVHDDITAAHTDLVNTNPIVYVYCSLSGGTGAGMLLDTCFLLREIFGPASEIVGMLAILDGLPTIPQIKRKVIRINTYAALKELHAFMTQSAEDIQFGEHIEYPLQVSVTIREPFAQCYLFSNKKADSTVSLPTQDHIASFQARMTFMMSAYMFKDEENTSPDFSGVMIDHVDSLITTRNGARLCYLAPGMGQVHFPINDVADMFVLEAAIRYIKYQCSGNKPGGNKEANEFFINNRLDRNSLRQEISKDPRSSANRILAAVSYDDIISPLLENGKERYQNRDGILAYGKKMPYKRLKEIGTILNANVENLFGRLWPLIQGEMSRLLIDPAYLGLGALDFLEDLKDLLETERSHLGKENQNSVDKDFVALESQWKQIEGIVTDVVTDDGILDFDWVKLPNAKALYITFLNGAESVVLDKARNELTRDVFTKLISELDALITKTHLLLTQHLPNAEKIIMERKRLLATKLQEQSIGKDNSVEDILSINVMTQELRNHIFENSPHLQPYSVLGNLVQRGWHPFRLLDVKADKDTEYSLALAQTMLDLIEPLTAKERRWLPLDVLSLTNQEKGQTAEEMIAKLINSVLKPQLQYTAMTSLVGEDPYTVYFCGGINKDLKERLENMAELNGAKFNISDNMETNRLNFFSCTLPVGLAGCDIVLDTFKPTYDRWNYEVGDMPRSRQDFEIAQFHCYPGSYRWKDPTQTTISGDVEEKMWFARALALSEMLSVAPDDLDAMKKTTKTPRNPLYSLFRVGKSQFWLWPFFEPYTTPNIQGKPKRLGANVFDAYVSLEEDELKRNAKSWVEWFEENWSEFFNSPEIAKLKHKAIKVFDECKGKTNAPKQLELWDDIKRIVDEWEIG